MPTHTQYQHQFLLPEDYGHWDQHQLSRHHRDNIALVINQLLRGPTVKVCYDVGANVGFISWLMLYWQRRVIAWEPNAAMLPYLNHNAAGIERLFTHALGNHNGLAKFTHNHDTLSQGARIDPHAPHTIAVQRLDDHTDLPPPDLIKIDVEGHEVAALLGMSHTLDQHHPWLVVEDKWNTTHIHQLLQQRGYSMHTQWLKDSVWHHAHRPIPQAPFDWRGFADKGTAPQHWPHW